MPNDRIDQEKDARHTLRILREQHELIESQAREILLLTGEKAVLRHKLGMYKDRIINMSLTPGQLIVRKLLEGRHYEALTGSNNTINP